MATFSYWASDHYTPGYYGPDYWGTSASIVAAYDCVGVAPRGGEGIAVDPDGTKFPFVDPEADVRGVLAYAYLSHEVDPVTLPLSVTWMYGFDRAVNCGVVSGDHSLADGDPTPTHDADILIKDADGRVVFDSTAATFHVSRPYTSRLRVYEWRTATAALVVAQHTAFKDQASVRLLPRIIRPEDGRLDERVGELIPKRVTSVVVPDETPAILARGIVRNGFNTTLKSSTYNDGLRVVTDVTLDVVPGSGEGTVPGCIEASDIGLRRINNVEADAAGNFTMSASGCYYIRQPGPSAAPTPATLVLGNDCGPCCSCDDFEAFQASLLDVWGVYKDARDRVLSAADVFRDSIARWEEEKACRESVPIKLNALAVGRFVDVAVAFCNTQQTCRYDVETTVDITTSSGDPISLEDGALLGDCGGNLTPYTPNMTGMGTIACFVDSVPPQCSVVMRFRVSVDPDVHGVTVKLASGGSAAGVTFPGPVNVVYIG